MDSLKSFHVHMQKTILRVQPFTNKVLRKMSCTLSTYLHGDYVLSTIQSNFHAQLPLTHVSNNAKHQNFPQSFSIIMISFIDDNDHFWAKHVV